MMKTPLLFLDVDGVLNSEANPQSLDSALLRRLRTVIDATGSSVCIISAWRTSPEMLDRLVDVLITGCGLTADRIRTTAISNTQDRWFEILEFLHREAGDYSQFAIVDDNLEYEDRPLSQILVRTDPKTGLSEGDVERLIALLNGFHGKQQHHKASRTTGEAVAGLELDRDHWIKYIAHCDYGSTVRSHRIWFQDGRWVYSAGDFLKHTDFPNVHVLAVDDRQILTEDAAMALFYETKTTK